MGSTKVKVDVTIRTCEIWISGSIYITEYIKYNVYLVKTIKIVVLYEFFKSWVIPKRYTI